MHVFLILFLQKIQRAMNKYILYVKILYFTDFLYIYFKIKQEAQGPWRLSTALQNISYECVRECISML